MLTGKTRYRQSLIGNFILQVEIKRTKTIDLNGSGYYDESSWTEWRDARFNDLMEIGLNVHGNNS